MKFLWIICACCTIFNSINARRIDFTIKLQRKPNTIDKLDFMSKGTKDGLYSIKQNKLRPAVTPDGIGRESSMQKYLKPKIAIKHISEISYSKNSSNAPTTRRPLMKNMKFTTKPHVIHYIHSRLQDEQSTLSMTKNSNVRIRFKPQNNKNNDTQNVSQDSVDDKFKTFIDIGDTGKQQDNFFATAASEKFKSVSIHSLLNTNESRSYYKKAFEESLEKIRKIRSRKKAKSHSPQNNTVPVPTQIKNHIIYIVIPSTNKNPAEILTASEKLALVTKLTEEPINSAKIKENVFNVVNLTGTINNYVDTTEKLQFTEENNSVATKIENGIFPVIRDVDDIDIVPTTADIVNSKSVIENFDNLKTKINIAENIDKSFIIQQSDDRTETPVNNAKVIADVLQKENVVLPTNIGENTYDTITKIENLFDTENTTEIINNSIIKAEAYIQSVTTTEKLEGLVLEIDSQANHTNVVKKEIEKADFRTTESYNRNEFATNSRIFTVTKNSTENIDNYLNTETSNHSLSTTETVVATELSDGAVITTDNPVNYADVIENAIFSISTKENKNDSTNINNSIRNTDVSIHSVATTETLVGFDAETDTPVTHINVVNTKNAAKNIASYSSCKTEILGDTETTTFNTEKFSDLVPSKEETNSSVQTKKSLYRAEIISTWPFNTADITAAVERSGKTILKTEKTVPFIVIVTGNSISLSDFNEAISNLNILEKKVDPNMSAIKDKGKIMKEENLTDTPMSVKDETSTRISYDLALRKKRRINVIDEEGVATTSNLFKFDERDGTFTVDCTFRNIHT